MAKIETLIEDIYRTLEDGVEVPEEVATSFGEKMKALIVDRLKPRTEEFTLRLSNLGKPCLRQLWYSAHVPELGEKLSGPARLKFLFGDIIEQIVLVLARLSGHSVTHEQHEVSIGSGVIGHIDALIDNDLVDIKSASPYSFEKFKSGLKKDDDAFGYLTQIGAYAHALGKRSGHFLPVHKVLGHLHLDSHELPEVDYEAKVKEVQAVLDSNEPPARGFDDEADGASGNRKLGVNCSYCEFKNLCWPGLRVIPYANGPRFMTKITKEPKLRKNAV